MQLHAEDCCVTELLVVFMVLVEFRGRGGRQCGYPHFSQQRVAGEAFSFLPLLCYGNLFQHLLEGLGSPCQFWWERTGEMLQLLTPGGADASVALPA